MKVSKFIIELFELSGLSESDFCKGLGIDEQQFQDIKAGTDENSSGVKTLLRALKTSLFSKAPKVDLARAEQDEVMSNKLTQAHAIIVTVGESEHLADHHQTSLSVASDLVEDARQKI